MTDDRHVDETRPDQTMPLDERREPTGFGDLPLQPTGSGVADEQMAYEQTELAAPPVADEDERPTRDDAF